MKAPDAAVPLLFVRPSSPSFDAAASIPPEYPADDGTGGRAVVSFIIGARDAMVVV
jgi:hypothetical protein